MRRSRGRGRGPRRQSDQAFQTINITPFTDVLLVLLIIFLIAGSSLSPSGVGVEELLRRSETSFGEETEELEQTVVVAEDGELLLLKGDQELAAKELLSLDKGLAVNVTAEPTTPIGLVVRVYDRLLQEGYHEVRFSQPQERL